MKYAYRALNAKGGVVTGDIMAKDQRDAVRLLRKQGLTVVEVKDVAAGGGRLAAAGKRRKASRQDLQMYMHQLATLVESKVALEETVDSLAESIGHQAVAKSFADIGAAIRRGVTFSEALKQSGLPLPGYFYPLVEAGELTGKLGAALRDAVEQWEYDIQTANELRGAMTYPVILIVSGVAAVLLIFVVVVPKFTNLLEKTKGEVPLLAKLVLGTGKIVNDNLLLVSLGAVAVLLFLVYSFANAGMRTRVRDTCGRLPFLGAWLMESDVGRWSAMLATLLDNRVSLLKSLELAQRYVSMTSLRARLMHVTQSVKNGARLAEALQEAGAITQMGFNLVRVGEHTGELPVMLRSLAKLYATSVRNRTKRFLTLLEPLAIIIIGAVIGLIMGGIVLAITSVNNISL